MTHQVTPSEVALLQSACSEIVAYGERVGVPPEQMVGLLNQGATVRELLEFLAAQGSIAN